MALIQRGFQSYDGNHAPDFVKNGNFRLNKNSPQARDLKLWVPSNDLAGQDLAGKKDLTVNSGTLLVPNIFSSQIWEAPGGVDLAIVENSADGDLDFGLADPFTVMCWVDVPSGADGTFISKAGSNAGERQYQMFNIGGNLDMIIHGNAIANITVVEGLGPTLVGFTKSGAEAANDVRIYKDGLFVTSGTAGTNTVNNADVIIGARRGSNTNILTGFELEAGIQVWDVRIHNVAFTDAEMFHAWNPATRWDLYHELGRRTYFFVPAAEAVPVINLVMAPYTPT